MLWDRFIGLLVWTACLRQIIGKLEYPTLRQEISMSELSGP